MALSTAQLRKAWGPPKKARGATFIPAYQALDDVFRRWQFDAGEGDTGAYNPRPITGGTDWSLHAYGPGDQYTFWWGSKVTTALAVDVDWNNNPYGPRLITNMPRKMIDEIEAIRTVNGKQVWSWGGDYTGSKDAMHFEIVCTPADLATGIAGGAELPAFIPDSIPPPAPSEEDDPMRIYALTFPDRPAGAQMEYWLLSGSGKRRMLNAATDLADMQAAHPTTTLVGTTRCNRWKSFFDEAPFGSPWP